MIKLDEKDIREIAWGRYVRRTRKKFLAVILPLFLVTYVVYVYLHSSPHIYLTALPLIIVAILFILYGMRITRFQKDLVKEWRDANDNKE